MAIMGYHCYNGFSVCNAYNGSTVMIVTVVMMVIVFILMVIMISLMVIMVQMANIDSGHNSDHNGYNCCNGPIPGKKNDTARPLLL